MNVQEEVEAMIAEGSLDPEASQEAIIYMAEKWVEEQARKRARTATHRTERAAIRVQVTEAARAKVASLTATIAKKQSHAWESMLDQSFVLPDGTRVTWGAATVAQHELRAHSLETMATSTLETAARHRTAVQALKSAGVDTLREL